MPYIENNHLMYFVSYLYTNPSGDGEAHQDLIVDWTKDGLGQPIQTTVAMEWLRKILSEQFGYPKEHIRILNIIRLPV